MSIGSSMPFWPTQYLTDYLIKYDIDRLAELRFALYTILYSLKMYKKKCKMVYLKGYLIIFLKIWIAILTIYQLL